MATFGSYMPRAICKPLFALLRLILPKPGTCLEFISVQSSQLAREGTAEKRIMKKVYCLFLSIIFVAIIWVAGERSVEAGTAAPSLTGRLLYHSYTDYDNEDSRLYMYDFGQDKLSCISDSFF